MSENTNEADALLAQGQGIVSVKAEDVIPAIAAIKDVQLLKAALVAENAGKVRVTVVAALEEAIKAADSPLDGASTTDGGRALEEDVEPVNYIDMVLDEPQFEGGPTTARVHPDEVQNYASGGWKES